MFQTGHVADGMKSTQSKKDHHRTLLDLRLNLQPSETIRLWFTRQYAASFLVPLLQSIFKTSSVIWGKQNSSDIVLAAALWMMSIILQQMTAMHLRIALSYLTYPYLADLALSNANPPLFPPGTGIPPCTPTVCQIGRGRDIPQERSMNIQSKVANNLPKTERGSTWTSSRRLWAYAELPALRTEVKRGMLKEMSETL